MHVDSMGVLAARGWLPNDITNIDAGPREAMKACEVGILAFTYA